MPNCFATFFCHKKNTTGYSILSFNPRELILFTHKSPANSAFGGENFAFLSWVRPKILSLEVNNFSAKRPKLCAPIVPTEPMNSANIHTGRKDPLYCCKLAIWSMPAVGGWEERLAWPRLCWVRPASLPCPGDPRVGWRRSPPPPHCSHQAPPPRNHLIRGNRKSCCLATGELNDLSPQE